MQSKTIIVVCILTFFIHFLAIVGLSARIVSTRTKRVASSGSLFNIISLLSSIANTIQAPLLANSIEKNIIAGNSPNTEIFRLIIFSATLGAIFGALFIPSMHRFMHKGVEKLYEYKSIYKVIRRGFSMKTVKHFLKSLTIPSFQNIRNLAHYQDIPLRLIFLNIVVYAIMTVSVLACLYAGYLNPSLRATSLSLNGISSALATLGMILFIEPYNSTLTDRVVDGSATQAYIRKYFVFVVVARVFGTLFGQLFLIPLSEFIVFISSII
jgi:hypothetical protein